MEGQKQRAAAEYSQTLVLETMMLQWSEVYRGRRPDPEAKSWKACDAALACIQRLCFNALDTSMLPSLFDRFLQRMLNFRPILAISTVGLALNVPVLSLQSLIMFFRGQVNQMDPTDKAILTNFCRTCFEKSMFMNLDTLHGDALHHHGDYPTPYLTSEGPWDGELAGESVLREKIASQNDQRNFSITDKALDVISRKVYGRNESVLHASALLKQYHTFKDCMDSLLRSYDIRDFFGGLERFGDTQFLMNSLGLPFANKFQDGFQNVQGGGVDPILSIGKINYDVYCLGVR